MPSSKSTPQWEPWQAQLEQDVFAHLMDYAGSNGRRVPRDFKALCYELAHKYADAFATLQSPKLSRRR